MLTVPDLSSGTKRPRSGSTVSGASERPPTKKAGWEANSEEGDHNSFMELTFRSKPGTENGSSR
jgi:hypothetical protein